MSGFVFSLTLISARLFWPPRLKFFSIILPPLTIILPVGFSDFFTITASCVLLAPKEKSKRRDGEGKQ